jgi:hypothetical protein
MFVLSVILIGYCDNIFDLFKQMQHIGVILMDLFLHSPNHFYLYT